MSSSGNRCQLSERTQLISVTGYVNFSINCYNLYASNETTISMLLGIEIGLGIGRGANVIKLETQQIA